MRCKLLFPIIALLIHSSSCTLLFDGELDELSANTTEVIFKTENSTSTPVPTLTRTITPTLTLTLVPTITISPTSTKTPTSTPKFLQAPSTIKGFQFGNYFEPDTFRKYLPGEMKMLKQLGANVVGVAVVWFTPDRFSTEIRRAPGSWTDGQFGITHSDVAIRQFAREARKNELYTSLHLQLACDYWDCWTGVVSPSNQAKWDDAYIHYAVEMASLAQELGINRLSLTNELESMQRREPFMLRLVEEVRDVYDGEIMISLGVAVWGDFQDAGYGGFRNVPISVLRAVDYVGLNFYPSGASHKDATLEEMVENITAQMNEVAQYYESIGIDNLTITEAGAALMDGGIIIPWEWQYSENTPIDLQEQADYYEAYLISLENSDLRDMVNGIQWWSWDLSYNVFEKEWFYKNVLSPARNPLVHDVLSKYWGNDHP